MYPRMFAADGVPFGELLTVLVRTALARARSVVGRIDRAADADLTFGQDVADRVGQRLDRADPHGVVQR